MEDIMKLIYANSQFVTMHFELYLLIEDEYPVYLEFMHNTDDDTLLLLMISDQKEYKVHEIVLN